ncbi:hypothetical protein QQS21_011891 [Conoideocrella luteorostrata]|uniref:Caspase domain-containing protein n=1 Tax=Conoideocrella luteorostrata TaxID=1105319 RepID=A0AAJ0FVE3_9HYPO|nr:hypothetical protein QQS21_011891 [Conoideocrella luteorostrata]
MSKRTRSPSPSGGESSIRPKRAFELPGSFDGLQEFARDLKNTVQQVLPTRGRQYDQAAVLAINFSESDIEGIQPLRDELLAVFKKQYNWVIETHVIDVNMSHKEALLELNFAVVSFLRAYSSRGRDSASLSCIYYSGHGFKNDRDGLTICSKFNGQVPSKPYIHWDQLQFLNPTFSPYPSDHRLLVLDCCSSGLAGLNQNIEVLSASAWESTAPSSPQASFTRALIDALKATKGAPISTVQLVANLHTRESVRLGRSMPICMGNRYAPPAIIHRIETTPPPPSPRVAPAALPHAHVMISVTVKKENSIPNLAQWAEWLKTNLPSYIGEIEIVAQWKTGSATVIIILPIEIWLALPDNRAYSFVGYHYMWNSAAARRRHMAALEPQRRQQQQQPLQEEQVPRMRHGNVPRPSQPDRK